MKSAPLAVFFRSEYSQSSTFAGVLILSAVMARNRLVPSTSASKTARKSPGWTCGEIGTQGCARPLSLVCLVNSSIFSTW